MQSTYNLPHPVPSVENNSGGGKSIVPPTGVKAWSWGAFFFNWIWSIFNRTWVGLFCLVPFVGFVVAIYLGLKGRELAWQSKRWESLEHFNRVQKKWSFWALVMVAVGVAASILAVIAIPPYQQYVHRNTAQSWQAHSGAEATTPQKPLLERLREDPPVTLQVSKGEAWLVSALPSANERLRVVVRFQSGSKSVSLLGGKTSRALVLLREGLCGSGGVLAGHGLAPTAISIVAYENGARIGEVPLPKNYCYAPAG